MNHNEEMRSNNSNRISNLSNSIISNNNSDTEDNNNNNNNNNNNRKTSPKCSIIFIAMCSINIIVLIYDHLNGIHIKQYTISLWPVLFKFQLYRIITHYFMHYGFMHMLINLLLFYILSKKLEKTIGTIYTFAYIIQSLLFTSIIYLFIMILCRYIIGLLINTIELNFADVCGLSSLLFALISFIFTFESMSNNEVILVLCFEIKRKHFPLVLMLVIFGLTSNFILMLGHLSGIYCGWLIKDYIGKYTLPSIKGVKWFESVILFKCLNSNCFIRITDKEQDYIDNINEMLMSKYDRLDKKKKEKENEERIYDNSEMEEMRDV